MTRLPRDVSGARLIRTLEQFGYAVVRQSGSHVRLTLEADGMQQHLTVPMHDVLKVGTLAAILDVVATQAGLTRSAVLRELRRR